MTEEKITTLEFFLALTQNKNLSEKCGPISLSLRPYKFM